MKHARQVEVFLARGIAEGHRIQGCVELNIGINRVGSLVIDTVACQDDSTQILVAVQVVDMLQCFCHIGLSVTKSDCCRRFYLFAKAQVLHLILLSEPLPQRCPGSLEGRRIFHSHGHRLRGILRHDNHRLAALRLLTAEQGRQQQQAEQARTGKSQ